MAINRKFGNTSVSLPLGEDNQELRAFIEKCESYTNAYNHFVNLALSIFKLDGLTGKSAKGKTVDIDESFLLKCLFLNGSVTFTEASDVGLICGLYTPQAWDWQGLPTKWEYLPFCVDYDAVNVKPLNRNNAVIVYLNKGHCGLDFDFQYYARLDAMLKQLLNNNVYVKSLQCILEGKEADSAALDEIIDVIYNQSGFVKICTEGGATAQDLMKFVANGVEWLADKIDQATTNLNNQLYCRLGINHTPYEKKERLNVEEIKTNDQALDLVRLNMFDSLKKGFNEVNEKFGTNITVKFLLDEYMPAEDDNGADDDTEINDAETSPKLEKGAQQ